MEKKDFFITPNNTINNIKIIEETRLETYSDKSYFEMGGQEFFQEHSNNLKYFFDVIKIFQNLQTIFKLD
jgi:hypothetical protein